MDATCAMLVLMQKGDLEKYQEAIKSRFEDLTRQQQTITQELYRLQGQYDLLKELIISNTAEGETSGRKSRSTKELAQ